MCMYNSGDGWGSAIQSYNADTKTMYRLQLNIAGSVNLYKSINDGDWIPVRNVVQDN